MCAHQMTSLKCKETCVFTQRNEYPCSINIALAGEVIGEEGPGPDPRLVCVDTVNDLGKNLTTEKSAQSHYYTSGQKSAHIWLKFNPPTKDSLVARIANGEVEYL